MIPLYPLFIKDPYFSYWAEIKNDRMSIKTWWGESKNIVGYLRVGEKLYSFTGDALYGTPMKVVKTDYDASATFVDLAADGVKLKLKFVSALPLFDYEILSCPVCEFCYEVEFDEGKEADGAIYFGLGGNVCANACDGEFAVRGYSAKRADGYSYAMFGKDEQGVLDNSFDKVGASWGYYVVSAKNTAYVSDEKLGELLTGKRTEFPPAADGRPESGCAKNIVAFDAVSKNDCGGRFYVAFDDVIALDYFGEYIKGYYFRNGKTVFDAIKFYRENQRGIDAACDRISRDVDACADGYAREYKKVLAAAYRQVVGAHKLAVNGNGELLFVSKENSSAGCASTVDISFPSAPLFLKFAPELVRGMITPVFEFASRPVWTYDFAPHDVGVYPHCNGQWYGIDKSKIEGGYRVDGKGVFLPIYAFDECSQIYLYDMQMPVEECGNMLILTALADKYAPDEEYLKKHFDLLKKWADYLVKTGLIPEKQLCTDDFAGHLDKNVNLAIKSVEGIKCFAEICKRLGFDEDYEKYYAIAKERVQKLYSYRKNGVLPLTFDGKEKQFSLKYNLYIDGLTGEKLFDDEYTAAEIAEYKSRFRKYGLPLDYRANYCKSDWMMWVAALSGEKSFADDVIKRIYAFLCDGTENCAFSDWYDADDCSLPVPKFRNRSAQGGLFAPCLRSFGKDPE